MVSAAGFQWISWFNPAFNFAVCLTNNFVVAGSHLENKGLAHVSWHWQLQTSWLNMFRQFVWVGKWVILFCRSYKFYLSTVGRGFTSNNASKRTIKLFSRLRQSKVVSILKKKLQWMKGKFYNILVSPNWLKFNL